MSTKTPMYRPEESPAIPLREMTREQRRQYDRERLAHWRRTNPEKARAAGRSAAKKRYERERRKRGQRLRSRRRRMTWRAVERIREKWITHAACEECGRRHGVTVAELAGDLGCTIGFVRAALSNNRSLCGRYYHEALRDALRPDDPSLAGERIRQWYHELIHAGRLLWVEGRWALKATGGRGVVSKRTQNGRTLWLRARSASARRSQRERS